MNSEAVIAMNNELGNVMDTPERVAAELMTLLSGTQKNRYIGWPERFFIKLNSVLPSLVDKALSKQLPIIRRQALATQDNHR
ncbi:hypothetical protein [Oceanicoccus sp. KOV_DT_Chl]|uniref:hypothetical protein n=1 Tax=Oceanicoccus sp. KOV_DT_Chl TaxID=1904639 RepID=UPI00190ED545|nr:hypothetical protein [Oceanicoccus sp. KOV_DT_Chl]